MFSSICRIGNISYLFLQVKVNKNNYTLTFSGHVGIGDQDLNQSFTRSISESMERNRQPNIPGNSNFHAFLSTKINFVQICIADLLNCKIEIECSAFDLAEGRKSVLCNTLIRYSICTWSILLVFGINFFSIERIL